MARVLKRCRSTIFRELKRNFLSDVSMPKHDGYYGDAAHLMTAKRRACDRKLIKHPELCKLVIERLKNGTEFVSWPHLQAEIGTQTWFCDPSSPWQKGTVENTNRRARRWLPRKRDIRAMTDHDIKQICDQLNNTPRKCLGWKTPAEVFREKMLEEMGRSPYPQRQ